jgi:aflatoxin B1 aldehyde reductase
MTAYVKLFDRPAMHEAIRKLKELCDAAEPPLKMQDTALRWLMHHSMMKEGDGVIIGAKHLDQLEANVVALRGGPLPEDIRLAMNGLQAMVNESDGNEKL